MCLTRCAGVRASWRIMSDAPINSEHDDLSPDESWEAQREAERALRGESASDDAAARLHFEANARLHQPARSNAEVSFARQMLQLVLIPSLIVVGVLGVWLILVTLGGRAQTLDKVLEELAKTGENQPQQQERSRMIMSLLGFVEDPDALTTQERELLLDQLPSIARQRKGGSNEQRAVLGALAMLGDPSSVDVFREYLTSDDPEMWFAAVSGLHGWRGDMSQLQSLIDPLIRVLNRAPAGPANPADDEAIDALPIITISVLSAIAPRGHEEAIAALAAKTRNATGVNRDVVWNASCGLAVLGDSRGVPVVRSLLDRAWLADQPVDPRVPESEKIGRGGQKKIITSTINVVVGFDPRLGGFSVRVADEGVWAQITDLAENDPDADVRQLARAALDARAAAGMGGAPETVPDEEPSDG